MLDADEIARRLREAMGQANVTAAALARTMRESPQAVYSWRKTGRIAKGKLPKLARAIGKPVTYFLEEEPMTTAASGKITIAELSAKFGLTIDEVFAAVAAASQSKQDRETDGPKKGGR